ncbi:50S ribosomal protein L35 [Candidatus Vallotia tarda]|uniref:Large ribosomal subunit protein bL35 n=2 Tax=Candidatus Vallotiella hemipterorum TaxID=1177213 RepID=A0A916JV88_9BURK|nr:50S ribosomal protein L35 [Candidatus Vallotia tarda]
MVLRTCKGKIFSRTPVSIKTGVVVMPKIKTKKSASKRFVVRPGGTVKRGQAFKRHILTKKTTKNKRHLRGSTDVHASDISSVRAMMPFA